MNNPVNPRYIVVQDLSRMWWVRDTLNPLIVKGVAIYRESSPHANHSDSQAIADRLNAVNEKMVKK
jgi:hypothetical protein